MSVKHRLSLAFQPSHVQEPLMCEMARRFPNLLFNVDAINVGANNATMRLTLIGAATTVKQAEQYLRSLNVKLRTLSSYRCKDRIPHLPDILHEPPPPDALSERKLWLTFLNTQKGRPILWEISRRFNVTYKITQCATGVDVAIMSFVIWGTSQELERVVAFLRESGISVEFGRLSASTPFGPEL